MKTKLSSWWRGLPFKSKIFLVTSAAFSLSVMLVELIIDPLVENQIFGKGFDELDWHEVPQWVVVAIALGLLGASVVTRAIMRRVDRIAVATDDIANGNLTARVENPGTPQDVFDSLSRSINAMAETIERLFTNERRLLSDISHELRSPLTRVGAAVELLSMHARDDTSQDLRRRVELHLAHINHLVELLLEQSLNRLAVREGRVRADATALLGEVADACQLKGATKKKP
ncbi:MAG: HAMP domain-containing protein [Planctomycetes bacterium]|nr:HAMP domain-containing protein [Planctomycetota bacterium]